MAGAVALSRPTVVDSRNRLRDLIQSLSVLKGNTFKLASGRTSNIFFDMKRSMLDPEACTLISELILEQLKNDDFDYIGGLELGAVPVVSQVCQKSYEIGRPIRTFIVRKAQKERGTNQLVEGFAERGARVVVIDDVTTTGSSVEKAIDAVEALGCKVVKVITIVDRLEGARENLGKRGIELDQLFTRDEFVN